MVAYLQLAHNERHPVTGSPVAKVIHNFGRAEKVDRDALARLVSSISRFLDPGAGDQRPPRGAEVEVAGLPPPGRGVDVGPGLGAARDRRGDPPGRGRPAAGREAVERVVFALVAQRALEPGSKLAGTGGSPNGSRSRAARGSPTTPPMRAMDFLLDALEEIAGEIFGSVAHLLNLDLDIMFVDTTSTYFELDVPDELAELEDTVDDDGVDPAGRGGASGRSVTPRTTAPTCRRW